MNVLRLFEKYCGDFPISHYRLFTMAQPLHKCTYKLKPRKLCPIITLVFFICILLSFQLYKDSSYPVGSKFFLWDRTLIRTAQQSMVQPPQSSEIIPRNLSKFIVISKRPRPGDKDCQNLTISLFEQNTFDIVGLASYPGSGNTWLRHLIEFSTGIFTGSVYFDEDLLGKGFLGEKEPWDSGSTIVQKLHLKYSSAYPFPRAILLIREPYPAIISFVHFKESGHLGFAQVSTLHHKKWPDYVLGQTFNWMSQIISWVKSSCKLHIVHYEKLKLDTKNELGKICQFLNVPCPNLESPCFEKNMDGLFHRKSTVQSSPVKLEDSVMSKILAGENYISNLLVRYGHDPLPVELYQYRRGNFQT